MQVGLAGLNKVVFFLFKNAPKISTEDQNIILTYKNPWAHFNFSFFASGNFLSLQKWALLLK